MPVIASPSKNPHVQKTLAKYERSAQTHLFSTMAAAVVHRGRLLGATHPAPRHVHDNQPRPPGGRFRQQGEGVF